MNQLYVLLQHRNMGGLRGFHTFVLFTTLFVTSPAKGQVLIDDPDASLTCFEEWHRAGGIGPSRCEGGAVSVETLVVRWDEFPAATIASVLDGLERLALTSENERIRIRAAVSLTTPGVRSRASNPTMSGIVERAARVYNGSTNWAVGYAIVSTMPRQAERAQALTFLKDVAREERPQDRGSEHPLAYAAVTHLAYMGEEGRAALQQLYASGEVRNARALGYLQNLSKQSFRDPTVGQLQP